jgi:hypothetical protein
MAARAVEAHLYLLHRPPISVVWVALKPVPFRRHLPLVVVALLGQMAQEVRVLQLLPRGRGLVVEVTAAVQPV